MATLLPAPIAPPFPQTMNWRREVSPFGAEPLGDFTVEASSPRVRGAFVHHDKTWERCYRELMDRARVKLEQEVVRRRGYFAQVVAEHIEPRYDDSTGEAWMYGRFDYELYRFSAHARSA